MGHTKQVEGTEVENRMVAVRDKEEGHGQLFGMYKVMIIQDE